MVICNPEARRTGGASIETKSLLEIKKTEEKELNNNINKLINKKKPQNIFMCKNNEYNNFN